MGVEASGDLKAGKKREGGTRNGHKKIPEKRGGKVWICEREKIAREAKRKLLRPNRCVRGTLQVKGGEGQIKSEFDHQHSEEGKTRNSVEKGRRNLILAGKTWGKEHVGFAVVEKNERKKSSKNIAGEVISTHKNENFNRKKRC